MENLFVEYTTSEIVIFTVILLFAVKEVVTFFDWANERLHKVYDKGLKSTEKHNELEDKINDLNKFYDEKKKVDDAFEKIDQTFAKMNECINMLIESDKEDIKSYVTEKHHFFVYEQCWIDDYSMECLERRFAVYKQEHGNSFVEGLMNEIRALPKQPPEAVQDKYKGTAEYVRHAKENH